MSLGRLGYAGCGSRVRGCFRRRVTASGAGVTCRSRRLLVGVAAAAVHDEAGYSASDAVPALAGPVILLGNSSRLLLPARRDRSRRRKLARIGIAWYVRYGCAIWSFE